MLKRTLVFTNPMILRLKNCQMVIAYKDCPSDTTTVPIEDLGCVIIESQDVDITIPLLNALSDNNVQVVFCNEKHLPNSMLLNLDTNATQGETLKNQISAGEVLKKQLWKQIIEAKILNQSRLLSKLDLNGSMLRPYYQNVKSGDSDNREAIAARLYFRELFGDEFVRDRMLPGINALMNYGYTILRAAVARSLVGSGLFPAIGVFHHNRSNAFPLADDMMEPYRPFVDEIVYNLAMRGLTDLTKDVKAELISVLYADTVFDNITKPLSVGLTLSSASLVKCYAKEETKLRFPAI